MSNKFKPIFFTSDLHIGHANSIIFDKRPFKNLDHMHTVLVNNYNSTVPENGVCYFLGDLGLCKGDQLKEFMSRLNNSTKVLILGNHDKKSQGMYEAGFDMVLNTAVFYVGDKRVSMSHCPLPGIFREKITGMKGARDGENWHGEFKNQRFTNYDLTVDYHLHGHCHARGDNGKIIKTDRQFDIGCPGNKFRPVSLSEVESWIALEEKKKVGKSIIY